MDELETQIVIVMKACEGNDANLDQILVGLYRKFKVAQQRRFLQNKLYRMSKKGLVHQVPGQRAVYTLTPPPAPQAESPHEDPFWEQPVKTNGGGFPRGGSNLDDEIPF